MYVGIPLQLTHSNKYIRFVYLKYRVAPATVLNQHIFITTFVRRPWFSCVCRYCLQYTIFVRIIHYLIILNTCSEYVHRDCAQRKSCKSKFLLVKSLILLVNFTSNRYLTSKNLLLHDFLCAQSLCTYSEQVFSIIK